jgi:hypothetical protein
LLYIPAFLLAVVVLHPALAEPVSSQFIFFFLQLLELAHLFSCFTADPLLT